MELLTIQPPARRGLRTGSLCSGYGGLDMAANEVFGATTAWHTEVDPAAAHVLATNQPGVPNHGDIAAVNWSTVEPVEVVTAGFPCQPVSAAGRQRAHADRRWLWPAVIGAVRALRPVYVVLENVENIVSIQKGGVMAEVVGDLQAAGYLARWCVLGACAVGACHHRHRFFLVGQYVGRHAAAAERVAVAKCGAPRRQALLPTPVTRDGDGRGEGGTEYWQRRRAEGRANGMPLGAALCLLPTATASDQNGSGHGGAMQGGLSLSTAVLPTPRASDGRNGGPNQRGRSGDLMLPSAVMGERFGPYTLAVALWGEASGRPAPAPLQPNTRGGHRLSPAFAEWMMGLPAGLVTDHVSRVASLRIVGNGVVPQQATVAVRHCLTALDAALDTAVAA